MRRSHIIAISVACASIPACFALAFYFYIGHQNTISSTPSDWGIFGDYFAGTAGTLLSFMSVALLLYTVFLQRQSLEISQDQMIRRDMLDHVDRADQEIENFLRRSVAARTQNATVELGDIVWGIVQEREAQQAEFAGALTHLHKLTTAYCFALGLYRDNVDSYHVYSFHRRKAEELIGFLEIHQDRLNNNMAGPSLLICRQLLNGERAA